MRPEPGETALTAQRPNGAVATTSDEYLLTCSASRWVGGAHRCRWCDTELPPGRTRWCSGECASAVGLNHFWTKARAAVMLRDDGVCQRCGAIAVEVHHREPCKGVRTAGCQHHLENLESLCLLCHKRAHANGPITLAITCYFREARGERSLTDVERASGINRGTLSLIEHGRLLPTDKQVEPLELAYGWPITRLYSPLALLAAQEDEDA